MNLSAAEQVMKLIEEDSDQEHQPIIQGVLREADCAELSERLVRFLRLDVASSGQRRIHLLQERAVLILGDLLWVLQQRGRLPSEARLGEILTAVSPHEQTRADILKVLLDPRQVESHDATDDAPYLAFINQFLLAVNEREIEDFLISKRELLQAIPARPSSKLRLSTGARMFSARTPMRVGISSANASDNWTFSKLRGGKVVNFAVDLADSPAEQPRPPIAAELERIADKHLVLRTLSRLETERATEIVITRDNAASFLALNNGRAQADDCFKDIKDPLLLLKFALVFTGVVAFRDDPQGYVAEPTRILDDIARFTGGTGLRLTVRSTGPSRAGFASSSCVALALLRVLYGASGQVELIEPRLLSSLALLMENEVGLKSGKQDTDGPLYPGIKAIEYPPTTGFLEARLARLEIDQQALCEHLWLVNSGIQRPAASGLQRGLNMRHYSYVSRDPRRSAAVMRSLDVHDAIVAALQAEDWQRLGGLFDLYLDLRETIDPGATQSIHDESAQTKVLRLPFEELRRAGLIHGGMYTGAMGGGCMMLVATPAGLKSESRDGRPVARLTAALERLKAQAFGQARPFEKLQRYNYS
ncbi:MAG: hypothetical protein MUF51_12030, partial [Vicinamibacteria bacterium]|nr:hypothetical protein [Vicinamibacteria bacterium]